MLNLCVTKWWRWYRCQWKLTAAAEAESIWRQSVEQLLKAEQRRQKNRAENSDPPRHELKPDNETPTRFHRGRAQSMLRVRRAPLGYLIDGPSVATGAPPPSTEAAISAIVSPCLDVLIWKKCKTGVQPKINGFLCVIYCARQTVNKRDHKHHLKLIRFFSVFIIL